MIKKKRSRELEKKLREEIESRCVRGKVSSARSFKESVAVQSCSQAE